MERCIIVAIADNNAIGKDNALLWHISEDLKFFKRTTSGSPVIMGRRTFESIGRPLPKRLNIIVTRGNHIPEGTVLAHSMEEAFAIAEAQGAERCFIIGGGQVYLQALPLVERLIVTHVHTEIKEADTFFPVINSSEWKIASRSEMMKDEETGYDFEFVEYIRN